jgi:hypothetical protein
MVAWLWLARRVPAEQILSVLGTVPVLMPFVVGLQAGLALVRSQLGGQSSTAPSLHQVLLVILEASSLVNVAQRVLGLLDTLRDLFLCVGSFLRAAVGRVLNAVGVLNVVSADAADCCTTDLRDLFGQVVRTHRVALERLGQAESVSAGLQRVAGQIGQWVRWPSDRRLKRRVRRDGPPIAPGLPWYRFEWNRVAGRRLGLRGPGQGVMSDDVRRVLPHAVARRGGYDHVDWVAILRYARKRKRRAVVPIRSRRRSCGGRRAT